MLASADNQATGGQAKILNFRVPASGDYHLRVSAGPGHSSASGNYIVAAYDATPNVAALVLNQLAVGKLTTPLAADEWNFNAAANTQIQFELVNESSPAITFTLAGPDGYVAFSGASSDSDLITLPTAGVYTLRAQSTGGQTGSYAFRINQTALTPLTLGSTFADAFTASGQAHLYSIALSSATPLSITLSDANPDDRYEIYVSRGMPPTRGTYDYRTANAAPNSSPINASSVYADGGSLDRSIIVPRAAAGIWYVLAYGASIPTAASFSVSANAASVLVNSMTPSHSGDDFDTRITLAGAGFTAGSQVAMIAADGTSYVPMATNIVSSTQLTATFAAHSVSPADNYTLRVTQSDGTQASLAGFKLVSGGQGHLTTQISVPNPLGNHMAGVVYATYTNDGDAPMAAPIITVVGYRPYDGPIGNYGYLVHANAVGPAGSPALATVTEASASPAAVGVAGASYAAGGFLTLDPTLVTAGVWSNGPPAGYSPDVQFLASRATPGIIQPGESATIPIYYAGWVQDQWNFDDRTLYFRINVTDTSNSQPIDWASIAAGRRPTGFTQNAWNALIPNLSAQLGPTWGTYVARLDADAQYLADIGRPVSDIAALWAFEIAQANGINPVQTLSSAVDLYLDAPALSLVVERSFGSTVSDRNQMGPFGYGWAMDGGWGRRLTGRIVDDENIVTITDTHGTQRVFQRDSRLAGNAPTPTWRLLCSSRRHRTLRCLPRASTRSPK